MVVTMLLHSSGLGSCSSGTHKQAASHVTQQLHTTKFRFRTKRVHIGTSCQYKISL